MSETLTVEELLRRIRRARFDIEEERVYFALRKMKVPYIAVASIETVAYCLALHQFGLKITVPLIAVLRNTSIANARRMLHTLGDKGVLTMIRRQSRQIEWVLNPTFLRAYYA